MYRWYKVILLLAFCFLGGIGLMVDPILRPKARNNPHQLAFEDVYPGLALIGAGLAVAGFIAFFSTTPKDPPDQSEQTKES